jgi:NAD(P)-dependent dehydrogenase (short-subunit alcohol dehydrogenase family)
MGERLKGKVAIVTGAGSIAPGIGNGRAAAIVFAREGARVVVVDINPESAQETKRLIAESGGEAITVQGDVSKSADCQGIVEECIRTYGRIDILHNNVGITVSGGPVETSEETWDRVMNVNLKSIFLTCKFALPHMERQGSGVIINISSINAIRVIPFPKLVYAASKAGVIAVTQEIAIQYAPKGIRANVILPGFIRTPLVEFYNRKLYGGDADEMWRRRDAMCPTGKQGEAWDIANAALFLASDEAKYITGAVLMVDGGASVVTRTW